MVSCKGICHHRYGEWLIGCSRISAKVRMNIRMLLKPRLVEYSLLASFGMFGGVQNNNEIKRTADPSRHPHTSRFRLTTLRKGRKRRNRQPQYKGDPSHKAFSVKKPKCGFFRRRRVRR